MSYVIIFKYKYNYIKFILYVTRIVKYKIKMNNDFLCFLKKKIPLDVIINYIIPYSYQLQDKKLLNDIVDYYESTSYINTFERYSSILHIRVDMKKEINTILYWKHFYLLKNGYLKLYMNNKNYHYLEKENKIESKIEKKIRNINNHYNSNVIFKLNWGLLNCYERKMIINELNQLYEA